MHRSNFNFYYANIAECDWLIKVQSQTSYRFFLLCGAVPCQFCRETICPLSLLGSYVNTLSHTNMRGMTEDLASTVWTARGVGSGGFSLPHPPPPPFDAKK